MKSIFSTLRGWAANVYHFAKNEQPVAVQAAVASVATLYAGLKLGQVESSVVLAAIVAVGGLFAHHNTTPTGGL